MSAEPQVAIALPAYNAGRWIGDALDSVIAQTYRPIDVVVCDDGSSDATATLARRFAAAHPEVAISVISQPRRGVGAARNHAVALAAGEFLAFLDADDIMTDMSISARVSVLNRDRNVEAVFGAEQRFTTEPGGRRKLLGPQRPNTTASGMLLRRSALERVGPFAEHAWMAEGLDWLLRAREVGLVEQRVSDLVLWRRVHDANHSRGYVDASAELAGALKASLDRRRSSTR